MLVDEGEIIVEMSQDTPQFLFHDFRAPTIEETDLGLNAGPFGQC
jgi:hypothetical protein